MDENIRALQRDKRDEKGTLTTKCHYSIWRLHITRKCVSNNRCSNRKRPRWNGSLKSGNNMKLRF